MNTFLKNVKIDPNFGNFSGENMDIPMCFNLLF